MSVHPNPVSRAVSHNMAPADVLALCRTLYGKEPQAMLFSIRGHDFEFGMTVSSAVEDAVSAVVQEIQQLVLSLQKDRVVYA
jgi:Ni,Fe-hydrogenase maturation factor